MNKIIFYVHKGNPDYLVESINFAKKKNPNIDFILLGNNDNKKTTEKWYSINDLNSDLLTEFQQCYVHMSTNLYDYEFFCFARWFYILEYMKKNKINQAGYIDSDIMLSSIPPSVWKEKYCYTADSGHSSFFTIEALEDLCKFMIINYKNKLDTLKEHYNILKKSYLFHSISDMTLISKFGILNNYKDLSLINNLQVFDHNINCKDNYHFNNGIKVIYKKNDIYYFKHEQSGELIEASSLHFQGDAKMYMKYIDCYTNPEELFYYNNQNNKWEKFDSLKFKNKKKKINIKQIIFKIIKKIDTILSLKRAK